MICFVCRQTATGPRREERLIWRPRPIYFAYSLCDGCFPYFHAAAPAFLHESAQWHGDDCFYCGTKTLLEARWCTDIDAGVDFIDVAICPACRRDKWEPARELALAARQRAEASL